MLPVSWLLLHKHIYYLISRIKLPVCFYYINIHSIWFYKYNDQFASTAYISFDLWTKLPVCMYYIHTYDLILCKKLTLPFCFYYIYMHVIWFYNYNDQFVCTYVHRIRLNNYINSFHLLHIPTYDLILWINLPVSLNYI